MPSKPFFQSKLFTGTLIVIGSLIVLLLVFRTGMYVGARKATFSYRWGENYHRMFGGPRHGFFQEFAGEDFAPGGGTVGTIISIDTGSLIIKTPEGIEKTVTVNDQATIRRGRDTLKISDLTVDERIVVIGTPQDNGTVEAKFIRVFDPSRGRRPPPPLQRRFPFPMY